MKRYIAFVVLCLTMVGCGNNDYTPKPQAYLRIDMPQHDYWTVDTLRSHPGDTLVFNGDTAINLSGSVTTFPFIFEVNKCAEVAPKDNRKGELYIDINYPQWDGVVFLTYKRLRSPDDLRGQTDTSQHLMESHYQFASGIEESRFDSPERHVHGTTFRIGGSRVASTYQFWVTDSVHHFLRGALYLNRTPNNDSLAPVINYIQQDIDHLIETLRWRQ